jgi:hypothetical protein
MRGLLRRLLIWLATVLNAAPPDAGTGLTATPVTFTIGKESYVGEITVNEGDPAISATVSYVNADTGEPAQASDTPVWSSADDSIASVEASADGMSATVTPLSSGDAEGGTAVVISVVAHDAEGDEVRSEGTVTVRPDPNEVLIGEITFATGSEAAPPVVDNTLPTPEPPVDETSGTTEPPSGDEPQVNPL